MVRAQGVPIGVVHLVGSKIGLLKEKQIDTDILRRLKFAAN